MFVTRAGLVSTAHNMSTTVATPHVVLIKGVFMSTLHIPVSVKKVSNRTPTICVKVDFNSHTKIWLMLLMLSPKLICIPSVVK